MKFTALMPVHNGVNFNIFKKAIISVLENKLTPSEFIIIIDGVISKEKIFFLKKTQRNYYFVKVIFKKKVGISKILNYGLKIAKHNIIARVDADDLNDKYRFINQIKFFKKNNLDILGTDIIEIINKKKFIKKMPLIPSYLNFFLMNPINHMSVMFKKDKIIKLGGYPEIKYKEDYALWLLAKFSKYKIYNLSMPLVRSTINLKTLSRRKNLDAILSEFKIQYLIIKKNKYFLFLGIIILIIRVLFLVLPNFFYIFLVKRINRYRYNHKL
jgi:amylovoran biosynthesis glycosyltransferase AmsE